MISVFSLIVNIEDHKPPQQKRVVEAPKPEPLRVGDMDRPRTDDGKSNPSHYVSVTWTDPEQTMVSQTRATTCR